MSPTSQRYKKNAEMRKDLCRFCGKQNFNHLIIDVSWNGIFFNVTEKLFSFTAEILNGLKICADCVAVIESICKFYTQVINISKIFSRIGNSVEDDASNIFQSGKKPEHDSEMLEEDNNSVSSETNALCKDSEENLDHEVIYTENQEVLQETVDIIKNKSKYSSPEIAQIENDVAHPEEIHIFDESSSQSIAQEIIKIEETEIFQETEIANDCSKVISEDNLSSVFIPLSKQKTKKKGTRTSPNKKTRNLSKRKKSCEVGDKILPKKRRYQKHETIGLTAKQKEIYNCSECKKNFPRGSELRKHFHIVHLKENVWECKICNQWFKNKISRTKHQKTDHAQVYKCEICGLICANKYNFKGHSETHFEYSCKICCKKFSTKDFLEDHEAVHLPGEERQYFECEICGKKVTSNYGLKRHQKLHLPGEEVQTNRYECLYCDAKFLYNNSLLNHINNEHLLESKTCSRKSQTESSSCKFKIKFHKKITSNKRMCKCEICGKTLSRADNLEKHKKLHLPHEEKEALLLECEHCGLKYLTKTTLQNHLRNKHSDIKPLCETCGKEFSTNWTLKLHLATHVPPEKRHYECDICSEKFPDYYKLRRHKKKICWVKRN